MCGNLSIAAAMKFHLARLVGCTRRSLWGPAQIGDDINWWAWGRIRGAAAGGWAYLNAYEERHERGRGGGGGGRERLTWRPMRKGMGESRKSRRAWGSTGMSR